MGSNGIVKGAVVGTVLQVIMVVCGHYIPQVAALFPVLGTAVWARLAGGNGEGPVAEEVRIVLGAVGSHPLRARAAEDLLRGLPLTEDRLRAAADAAAKPAKPMDNTDLTLSWRKEMVKVEVARALREIAQTR